MAAMKTPGVYIVEKSAFPNSVVEVATAVPAFIGYTEKAQSGTTSIRNTPWRITSMAEFHNFFGGAPTPVFTIKKTPPTDTDGETLTIKASAADTYYATLPKNFYTLYYNILLFYANGGGPCYIVSVGDYDTDLSSADIIQGINPLIKEQEPTMVVIPEAVNFPEAECIKIQQAMLMHCGDKMKNRFAILDVWNGINLEEQGKAVKDFREDIGSNFLSYCASYFPWIETSILTDQDLTYQNLQWNLFEESQDPACTWPDSIKEVIKTYEDKKAVPDAILDKINSELHSILAQNWGIYKNILAAIKQRLNLLPPSAAMAGIYTMVDNSRGVWKAPANVSINNVVKPSCNITHDEQEDLNVPLTGKAVNAIRFFTGEGVKIWGARTMDGNSLDWRYINVRRTMIFLEESIKNAARAYVFEPNVAGTWINMKGMIENFLRGIWKRGGLAGATPEDAFSVHVGLGDTMTPEDILEGILRITVLVAISRPAEFIEITFQQQMQKS